MKNIIALIAGVMFFNLSFFQIELNSLKLAQKNRQVYENIIRLMSGINEEEKGASGESSTDTSHHAKEVDLFLSTDEGKVTRSYVFLMSLYGTYHDNHPLSGALETLTQPPEG